jgi:hypothetical protein
MKGFYNNEDILMKRNQMNLPLVNLINNPLPDELLNTALWLNIAIFFGVLILELYYLVFKFNKCSK